MTDYRALLMSHLSQAFHLGRARGFSQDIREQDWDQVADVLLLAGQLDMYETMLKVRGRWFCVANKCHKRRRGLVYCRKHDQFFRSSMKEGIAFQALLIDS